MRAVLSSVLLSVVLLPAQEPVLVRASDPFVLRVQGPARLRAAFLATNVGTLLESKESTDFWSMFERIVKGRLREVAGDEASGRVAALVDGLRGYAGTITVAGELTPHPEAWAGIAPDLGGVVVLEPDGRTDLDALAAAVRDGLRGSRFRVEDVEIAGRTVPLVATSKRGGVVLPFRVGDRLVAMFGEDVRGFAAARLGAGGEPAEPDDELRAAPVSLRVDLERLVALEKQDPTYTVSSVSPDDMARATGLASLRELRITARPRGPAVAVESAVRFAPGVPRGFFGALMPDAVGAPRLVALVPDDAPFWQAGKLRLDLLARAAIESIAAWSRSGDETFEHATERIREQGLGFTGVDLEKDLFSHLDGESVLLGSLFGSRQAEEGADPARVGADAGTVLFGFGVRDRAKFADGWSKFLGAAGAMFVGRDEVGECEGVELHAMSDWAWALADETFFVGFGDDAAAWLEKTLVRRRGLLDGGALQAELPRDVERRLRHGPDGFQGCGAFDVRSLIGVPVFELLDVDDLIGEFVGDGWAQAFESLRPFLAKHEIDRAYGFAGWTVDRWAYRVLW